MFPPSLHCCRPLPKRDGKSWRALCSSGVRKGCLPVCGGSSLSSRAAYSLHTRCLAVQMENDDRPLDAVHIPLCRRGK